MAVASSCCKMFRLTSKNGCYPYFCYRLFLYKKNANEMLEEGKDNVKSSWPL